MIPFKILFVEDDQSIDFLVSRYKFWEKNEYRIEDIARNGKEALELLEKNTYDIVVTDIRMPIMDGMQLFHCIKERAYAVYVILASNYSDFTYAKQGIRLGAVDYIEKPYTEEKLITALELARSKMIEEEGDKNIEQGGGCDLFQVEDKVVQKMIQLIHRHVNREGILDILSEEMALSKDYLGKLFKNGTGITVSEYFMIVKMEQAKRLLKHSHKKVYEISLELGYTTVDYFTKLFKKYTGTTPSQFRKESR